MLKYLLGGSLLGYGGFMAFADQQSKYDFDGIKHSVWSGLKASYSIGLSVFDYQYKLGKFEKDSEEYFQERSRIHTETAKKILWLSTTNRGIYLKAGQYISTLERIAPKEYTDVLKVLQDRGPSLPLKDIRIAIDHDFKKLEDIYEDFEENAIAAASLAQVHKAKLKNGPEVAVKIQFPYLRTQFKWDLFIMKRLIQVLDRILEFNDYKDINLTKRYDIFSSALKKELDFNQEVENAEKTRELFKGDDNVYIPKNYKEFSNTRIITQEFVYGVKINEKESIQGLNLQPLDCAKILIDTFSKMIFLYGHIHCDAHPGNILVRNHPNNPNKPQLILLDHGFYRSLSEDFRMKYSALWKSLISFDYSKTKEISESLGIGEYYKFLPLILLFRTMKSKKKIGEKFTEEEKEEFKGKDAFTFEKVNHIMNSMPPDMLFIIRASNLVAIHNATLGGATRDRLLKFTDLAFTNLYPNSLMRSWQKIKFYVKVFLFETFHHLFVKFYNFDVE